MNYYIQGNKDKAEEIKAAFEAKGYDISWPGGLAEPNVINIGVERNGAKYVVAETAEYIRDLIKTHPDYKELELPVEPNFKVGDWLVYNNGNCFAGGLTEVQIVKVKDGVYFFASGTSGSFKFIDENCRLWTIADAKDGDVLVTDFFIFLFKKVDNGNGVHYYCHCGAHGEKFDIALPDSLMGRVGNTLVNYRRATKEQCDLFFKKMNETGYQWDADKKELRKIKPHYDIKNFHAGMPVLVRDDRQKEWCYALYSHYDSKESYQFVTAGDIPFIQCIPFNDETKHLLGTTDMCDEMYINW